VTNRIYFIPFETDRYIIYRPLAKLAFIGNRALVDLLNQFSPPRPHPHLRDSHPQIVDFLESIGFFEPDPPQSPGSAGTKAFDPMVAVLCLTTSCNFKCIYCYAEGGEHNGRALPMPSGARVIDIVAENAGRKGDGRFEVAFHGGGEPTMTWKLLQDLTAHARGKENPAHISLASNGYWEPPQARWIVRNIDSVSLSLDGIRPVQNLQRPMRNGSGSFDRVMSSIGLMDRHNVQYGIRLTVTDHSVDMLEESVSYLCQECGCQVFQVEPAFGHGRAQRDALHLSAIDAFHENFMKAYDVATSYGRHLYYSGARPFVIADHFCSAPFKALIVTPDNDITACYEVCSRRHPLHGQFFWGRVSGTQVELDHPAIRRMTRKLDARRRQCASCFCFWHCAGDCPSKVISADGDGHLENDDRCRTNRWITKALLVRYIHDGNGVWQGQHPIEAQRQNQEACM
jgi:uncharacterized protein